MSLMQISHSSLSVDWPHNDGVNVETDAVTAQARRENLRRRARLQLAHFLAEGENTQHMLKRKVPAESADDIDFGRSDCEFLFRD